MKPIAFVFCAWTCFTCDAQVDNANATLSQNKSASEHLPSVSAMSASFPESILVSFVGIPSFELPDSCEMLPAWIDAALDRDISQHKTYLICTGTQAVPQLLSTPQAHSRLGISIRAIPAAIDLPKDLIGLGCQSDQELLTTRSTCVSPNFVISPGGLFPNGVTVAARTFVTGKAIYSRTAESAIRRRYENAKVSLVARDDSYLRMDVEELRGEVLPHEGLWERLELTVVFVEARKRLSVYMIGAGYYAPGVGKRPPSLSGYLDMEPRYTKELANHISALVSLLEERFLTEDNVRRIGGKNDRQ